MGRLPRSVLLLGVAVLSHTASIAEQVEHDVCSCKVVQIGAQSTLKGGVCQRTEASNCLMQWGSIGSSISNQKVSVGNGLSQEQAALSAQDLILKGMGGDYKVPPLVSQLPPNAPPLQIAFGNLSQLPPETYGKFGMVESFLLVAATALARFNLPIDVLAQGLRAERRTQLVAALQKEGSLTIGPFSLKGRFGCLEVDVKAQELKDYVRSQELRVYVKTPFAASENC